MAIDVGLALANREGADAVQAEGGSDLKQTGRVHSGWRSDTSVVSRRPERERKKRLCLTRKALPCCASRRINGTPGLSMKLCMILSTDWWEVEVWAFQKSSAVALP